MEKRLRVLITDDNRHFCSILKETIDKDPMFTVVGIAHDGISALDMIAELQPDLVILDIIMPMLDGLGVLEKARLNGYSDHTRFIVMSAVGHDDITFRAMNLGAMYYVVKPFDLNEFLRRLKEFAGRQVPASEPEKRKVSVRIDNHIIGCLRELGVPMHVRGYQYIQDAVRIVIESPGSIGKVTKNIYPVIAEMHDTTSSRVERAIRNAIDLTFVRGNRESLMRVFNAELGDDRKLTNSEFIVMLADRIRSESTHP